MDTAGRKGNPPRMYSERLVIKQQARKSKVLHHGSMDDDDDDEYIY